MDRKLLRLFWIWVLMAVAFAAQSFACTLTEIENPEVSQTVVQPAKNSQLLAFIQKFNRNLDPQSAQSIANEIVSQSQSRDVDPYLVAALFARESSFNPYAVSKTNAKGLGQLKDFHYEKYQVSDPFNIEQNVRASVTLLSDLKKAWKGELSWESQFNRDELMLSSYFIGLGATQRSGGELPEKARKYIREILDYRKQVATLNS